MSLQLIIELIGVMEVVDTLRKFIRRVVFTAQLFSLIWTTTWTVYKNNKQFNSISERFKALKKMVKSIKPEEKHLAGVSYALTYVHKDPTEAECTLNTFNGSNLMKKFLKSTHYKTKFNDLEKNLSHAWEKLSCALYQRRRKEVIRRQHTCIIL